MIAVVDNQSAMMKKCQSAGEFGQKREALTVSREEDF